MGLIKSQNAPPTLQAFSMADVEAYARAIVAQAREKAEQLLTDARAEGARIRQNSYDQGFAAGIEDGTKKGTEDGRAAFESLWPTMYDDFLKMFQGIEEEEYKTFVAVLHRILQNIRLHEI